MPQRSRLDAARGAALIMEFQPEAGLLGIRSRHTVSSEHLTRQGSFPRFDTLQVGL